MRLQAIDKLKNLDRPVMITGHTGFKGTWLTLLLESQGIEVTGISLEPEKDSLYSRLDRTGQIDERFLDIRDFESVNAAVGSIKPSVVFHMAAQPLVLQSYVDPRGTFETNVMGTANVLESISSLRDRSYVVAITTDKVYENLETGAKFKENDKLQGKDPYSASKVGTESVVAAWKNIWKLNDAHKLCSARAGNVIGGGDFAKDRLIPDIIRGILDRTAIEIRNPESSRPWQHVLDPLSGYVYAAGALLSGVDMDGVNFGPREKSLSVQSVITIAQQDFPGEAEFVISNSQKNQPLESGLLDLDSSLARTKLGWEPKWNQEEAIHLTFSWWKSILRGTSSTAEACSRDIAELLEES
ncbi:CDP-glucose 4,6-dehydratase [Candidatus Planktophila dulcis]|uniref:CDP-glucose 4,6-dehydratase n=1 Tax=Candidatus Planktophila dulcis TaxID=1884914 RepID=UPI003CED8798